jgi:hypothetical protein
MSPELKVRVLLADTATAVMSPNQITFPPEPVVNDTVGLVVIAIPRIVLDVADPVSVNVTLPLELTL